MATAKKPDVKAAAPAPAPVTTPVKAPAGKKPLVKKATAKKAPAKPVSKTVKPVKAVKAVKTVKTAKPAKKVKAVKTATPVKAVKVEKPKKPKLVRDSFTIPKAEYLVLEELKQRAAKLTRNVKKSELLRAGIKSIAALSDAAFLAALDQVPAIKTGRPSNN